MAQTISPVVHGGDRRRYWTSFGAHAMGALLSSALFGALLGLLGALVPWRARVALAALAVAAALLAARDLLVLRLPLPALRRQVPEWWRTFFSAPVAAALYGAGLGVGFFTHLYAGTLVVVAAGAFGSTEPVAGAVVYGSYGLARAASLLVAATAEDDESLERLIERLEGRARGTWWRRANGVVLAAVTLGALAAL